MAHRARGWKKEENKTVEKRKTSAKRKGKRRKSGEMMETCSLELIVIPSNEVEKQKKLKKMRGIRERMEKIEKLKHQIVYKIHSEEYLRKESRAKK